MPVLVPVIEGGCKLSTNGFESVVQSMPIDEVQGRCQMRVCVFKVSSQVVKLFNCGA